MRITQSDRLVFQITAGDITNGVTGIKILEASGHYPHEKQYGDWIEQPGTPLTFSNDDG